MFPPERHPWLRGRKGVNATHEKRGARQMDRDPLFLAQTQEGCDLGRFHKSMPNSHTINSRCKLPNVELLGARDDRDACRHDLQKHHQLMDHRIVPNILEKRGWGTLMGGG